MQLNAVETGLFRILGGMAVICDDAGDFLDRELSGLVIILTALERMRMAGCLGCAGRDGRFAAEEIRVHETAHVPQLKDDPPTLLMNRIGDELPAFDLLLAPDSRRRGPAEAFHADAGGFGNDQAGACTLAIIGRHHFVGDRTGLGRPAAGERSHENAVLRLDGAKSKRFEQFFVHPGMVLLTGLVCKGS